jgi:hypothetical protein
MGGGDTMKHIVLPYLMGMKEHAVILTKAEIKTLRRADEIATKIRELSADPEDFYDAIADGASDIQCGVVTLMEQLRGQKLVLYYEEVANV